MNLRLTQQQRLKLFRKQPVSINGEGTPPVQAGETIRLSSKVHLIVHRVHRKQERWSLHYTLVDTRDPVRKLKRTPHAPQIDPSEPTQDAVRDAAEQSAYTAAPTSLSDAGEAVDSVTQARISKEASMNKGQSTAKNKARRSRYEMELRLARAREIADMRGVDVSSAVRVIERQVEKIEKRAYEGEAA